MPGRISKTVTDETKLIFTLRSRDSAVGIAAGYGLDD
jgi:hypothetical protein